MQYENYDKVKAIAEEIDDLNKEIMDLTSVDLDIIIQVKGVGLYSRMNVKTSDDHPDIKEGRDFIKILIDKKTKRIKYLKTQLAEL